MSPRGCNLAARYANSRACNGSSPIWRLSSKARNCCSTALQPARIAAFRRLTKHLSPGPPATSRGSRWRTRPSRLWGPPAIAGGPHSLDGLVRHLEPREVAGGPGERCFVSRRKAAIRAGCSAVEQQLRAFELKRHIGELPLQALEFA